MPFSTSPQSCATVVLESLPGLMQHLRQIMRDVRGGLTVPQFRVLAFLDRQPGSSLVAVADFIGVGKATASAMIATLERDHLVLRKPTRDRRSVALHVSPAGQALLGCARAVSSTRMAQHFADLDQPALHGIEEAFGILNRCFVDPLTAAVATET